MKYINILFLILVFFSINSYAEKESIILQSTTSSRDSGLLNYLIPKFFESFGINIKVVANGTGQALRNAKDCNGDLLLVHSPKDELKFISDGYGLDRYELMSNDYIIIGPSSNKAQLLMSDTPDQVFTKIANNKVKFISRSDDSGTNKKELSLWKMSGLNEENFDSSWYIKSGQGMGPTLNIAIGMNGYTLTDRSTWIRFKNKSNHKLLYASPTVLKNTYSLLTINPENCPDIKSQSAAIFVEWLLSDKGRIAINSYVIDDQQVFVAE